MRAARFVVVLLGASACSAPAEQVPREQPLPGVRRLTSLELSNTIEDVLGVLPDLSALPPDPKVDGFSNTASALVPTARRTEGYAQVALAVARALPSARLRAFGATPQAWLEAIGLRLFRRPLTANEASAFRGLFEGVEFDRGARRSLEAMLQSPRFLYRLEPEAPGRIDEFSLATRLSYFLWQSAPDEALLQDAANGQLRRRLPAQVDRMLAAPRARTMVRALFDEWFSLPAARTHLRSSIYYPELSPQLRQDMYSAVHARLQRLVFEEDRPLTSALTDQRIFATGALARLYGAEPSGESMREYSGLPHRAGLLSEAAVLTASTHGNEASIIDRGVYILERFLCERLPPPPPSVGTLAPPMNGASQRERLAAHRNNDACKACHERIDPLGFALEPFDAIGAHRLVDREGNAIEVGGRWRGQRFESPHDFAEQLSQARAVRLCMVEKPLQFALGRPVRVEEQEVIEALAGEGDVRLLGLLRSIALHPVFVAPLEAP